MDSIFTLRDEDENGGKLDLDSLYEKKHKSDLAKIGVYKRILGRVHARIKMTSRGNKNEVSCWYLVPEIMLGIPEYDSMECTKYLLHALQENGLAIQYTEPNLIFIYWGGWVPGYVRSEIKKKTGVVIDGNGVIKDPIVKDDISRLGARMTINEEPKSARTPPAHKDVNSYKPSGKNIYSDVLFSGMK